MTSASNGDLMFRCPKTGRGFKSGFSAGQGDLAAISSLAHMRTRCPECGEPHEFKFADGWIQARPATAQIVRAHPRLTLNEHSS